MSKLNNEDCITILKAVYKIAGADLNFAANEKVFLKKIADRVELESGTLPDVLKQCKKNVLELCDDLTCERARKIFLLALTTMALADEQFEQSEKEILEAVTEKLQVGQIKLGAMDYQKGEQMILKLLEDK